MLSYLRSCGRARSWSEKQRLQNLWTKRGYDLAFKACGCKCGKGHLRKDTDYEHNMHSKKVMKQLKIAAAKVSSAAAGPNANSLPAKPGVVGMRSHYGPISSSQQLNGASSSMRPQLRVRTNSISSTGSSCSPPSSAGTPPQTPGSGGSGSSGNGTKKKFDFFTNTEQAAAGNIFKRRTDYSVFGQLPRHQQNPYHIKMEDEGPHGNDETRCFVLTNLSTHGVTSVNCVVCNSHLPVFDKYPLIDGTFFLSPQRYNMDLQVSTFIIISVFFRFTNFSVYHRFITIFFLGGGNI